MTWIEQVDRFCRPTSRQVLDPNDPVTVAPWWGLRRSPRCVTLAHAKQMQALDLIPHIAAEFKRSLAGTPVG